jgi:hypothetical protein
MMENSFSVGVGDDDDEVWVHDSSVDHRGRPPSCATTGAFSNQQWTDGVQGLGALGLGPSGGNTKGTGRS